MGLLFELGKPLTQGLRPKAPKHDSELRQTISKAQMRRYAREIYNN